MKTTFDCVSRILLFSTWLYVANDGQFSSAKTVLAFYTTFLLLVVFNTVFNKTGEYCSAKTWTGKININPKVSIKNCVICCLEILLNSMSSVLSYNVFDFTTVFAKADKNVKDKKRVENHEPSFVKQMLYCLGFISLNLG